MEGILNILRDRIESATNTVAETSKNLTIGYMAGQCLPPLQKSIAEIQTFNLAIEKIGMYDRTWMRKWIHNRMRYLIENHNIPGQMDLLKSYVTLEDIINAYGEW